MSSYSLYSDGASRGNPGHSGIGVVIKDENSKIVKKVSQYIGQGTNNVAEYQGAILALEYILDSKLNLNKILCLCFQTNIKLCIKQYILWQNHNNYK